MTSNLRKLRQDRELKQNPYAYLSDKGGYLPLDDDAAKEVHLLSSVPVELRRDRALKQDPYAHLNDKGNYSFLDGGIIKDVNVSNGPKSDSAHTIKLDAETVFQLRKKRGSAYYSRNEVEARARMLLEELWRNRLNYFKNEHLKDPVCMLDPLVSLKLMGFAVNDQDTLGQYVIDGKQFEVAGIIDDSLMQVDLSMQFTPEVRRFTAAHELGHALLHDARGLHRDRPLDGSSHSKDGAEREADWFATCFLMPEKLTKERFEGIFGGAPFFLNEETCFALGFDSTGDPRKHFQSLRELTRTLVTAESYNGKYFVSLTKQFKVSAETMAIRLEELGLVVE